MNIEFLRLSHLPIIGFRLKEEIEKWVTTVQTNIALAAADLLQELETMQKAGVDYNGNGLEGVDIVFIPNETLGMISRRHLGHLGLIEIQVSICV